MYREDMSTSSEDDTSTAGGARAVSTPRTADMYRSKVRKGVKVLECTGCGYTSDRRANVTRHYGRIHVQREKLRKCTLCDKIFQTKGDFYKHCLEYHPDIGPSYTAIHKYKIRAKSKLKPVSRPRKRVECKSEPVFSPKTTRSSMRLRSQKILSDKSNNSSMISCNSSEEASSITTVEPMSTSCSSVVTSAAQCSFSSTSIDEASSMTRTDTELFSSSYSSENDSPSKNAEQSFDGYRSYNHPNNENSASKFCENLLSLNSTNLPIKKRYLIERRLFADITNNNVEVQKIQQYNSNNNKVQILFQEFDLVKFNEKFRAYINDINFDKFSATMKYQGLKSF